MSHSEVLKDSASSHPVVNLCAALVNHAWFNYSIIGLIILNAIVIGLETSDAITAQYHGVFDFFNTLVLVVFTAEALLKMVAESPKFWRYFYSGWNCFDFTIVVLSLIPSGGSLATVARLVRLLRILRLVSVIPELRLIVDTLMRSIPSMGHIALLMGIIFYIYGVAGYTLFHDIDPLHWRNLGISLLSLFRIVTLEDWTDVMYAAMAAEPWAWMYFVSFVIVGTFVMINLFVAVVLNNLEQTKAEALNEMRQPPGRDELVDELRQTQEILARLQERLNAAELNPSSAVKNNKD